MEMITYNRAWYEYLTAYGFPRRQILILLARKTH